MRILIVDDDPDTRDIVIRALREEFREPEIVQASDLPSLDTALAGGAPDVLVTDYDLRWGDGLQVFDRVKAASPDCCAVMFTGTGNEELAVRAMKRGFDDYLVKKMGQFRRLASSARIAYERAAERKGLRENRDLLLKELYHRIHNNLQLVISLLNATAKSMPDAGSRERIRDLGRRIQALSVLQEQFYRAEDFRHVDLSAYLGSLARGLVDLGIAKVDLDTRLDAVEVPVAVAVPLGLIANEILMNAVKHAFPQGHAGRVTVRLERWKDGLSLTIADDGVGSRSDLEAAPTGLGIGLVRRLAAQIDADVAFSDLEPGTECRVTVRA
jgi:two-component sensor histidine kinase